MALSLTRFFSQWVTHNTLLDRLKIRQRISHKLGYGYALALGTAILGTGLGIVVGSTYSQQAQIRADQSAEKERLLNELNRQVLGLQMYPLRLLSVSNDSRIWLQYENNQYNSDLAEFSQLLEDIEKFSNTPSAEQAQSLQALGESYATIIKNYEGFTKSLWDQLRETTSKRETKALISAEVSGEVAGEISLAFEKLSEDLIRVRQSVNQEQQLVDTQLRQAKLLQLLIVLGSMTISIGLAIALALITSRTIAKPVEQVTALAQKVTDSGDFNLQAAINTQDEVARLARALNQLISWTGQYTQELQQARDTLEQRVDERTEALQHSELQLRQKAEDLQSTLAELKETQLQLIQTEKMSSLGQMVAGIAHEINNPVNFIHGNLSHTSTFSDELFELLDLYQTHYPKPPGEIAETLEELDLDFMKEDFPKVIESMLMGTERIREIVLSLRTFSHLDESALKAVDLHEGLDSTLNILRTRINRTEQPGGISIVKDYGELPFVECYAAQLNQVFLNVLSNAIDAVECEFTVLTIVTHDEESRRKGAIAQLTQAKTQATICITTQQIDNDWVAIQIKDNGPGIDTEIQSNVFDPFFTTKDVGKGTGMGLATSYQIVTQMHSGQLTCDSDTAGTVFTIHIPIKAVQEDA